MIRFDWLEDITVGAEWEGELAVRLFEAFLILQDVRAAQNIGS